MSCENELAGVIRAAGRRYTIQRGLVMAALHHGPPHQTADQIFEAVQRADPRSEVALSTVYRTLASLEEVHLVTALRSAGAETVYEAGQAERHHHLICRACGGTVQLELASLTGVESEIRERTGFEPLISHLAVPGLCSACLPTTDASSSGEPSGESSAEPGRQPGGGDE
ncbi:MAG: Fur family transcriptional regulator [Chloroflexi bacterium]|nr:Fur family transcriptional regulator [Chloroflexota bacterium]MDA1146690.1 Fur family transcriptional regulator [Chloroflexota bacterium]